MRLQIEIRTNDCDNDDHHVAKSAVLNELLKAKSAGIGLSARDITRLTNWNYKEVVKFIEKLEEKGFLKPFDHPKRNETQYTFTKNSRLVVTLEKSP